MQQELDANELETWAIPDLKFLKIEGSDALKLNILTDQLFGLQKNNCSIAYLSLCTEEQRQFYIGLSLPSKECPPTLLESGIVPRSSFIEADELHGFMDPLLNHVGLCTGIPQIFSPDHVDSSHGTDFSNGSNNNTPNGYITNTTNGSSSNTPNGSVTNYGSLILATPISKEHLWSEEFNVAEQIRVAKNGLDPEKQPTIQDFVEKEQEYFDYILNTYQSGAWLVCPYYFAGSEETHQKLTEIIQTRLEPALKIAPLKTYSSTELRPFAEHFAWLKNERDGEFVNQLLKYAYLSPLSSASLARMITVLN